MPRTPPSAPWRITIALKIPATEQDALRALARDVTDRLGRTISPSAVLRALARLASTRAILLPLLTSEVENELNAGRRWGHVVGWKAQPRRRKQKGGTDT